MPVKRDEEDGVRLKMRKASVRLPVVTLDFARQAGAASGRSVPAQIDYWAALGRKLECHVDRAAWTRCSRARHQ